MAKNIDLYQQHKQEYVAPKSPVLLTIKPAKYLAIDGECAPGGSKLEGLWPLGGDPAGVPQEQWRWTLLIRTPTFVSAAELRKAVTTLISKGKPQEVKQVRLEAIDEGACVQVLHVGPYSRFRRIFAFQPAKGSRLESDLYRDRKEASHA